VAIDPGRRRVGGAAAALLALVLGVGGCGGTSRSSSTSSTTSPTAAANTTISTTTSTTRAHTTTKRRRSQAHSSTSTATTTTKATSTPATSTAPPPTPAGTPAAPDGLRQVTGYGSYELCAGTCSGAVPASLRRPLHLPHGCPASGGGGPVTPAGGTADIHVTEFIGSSWRAARVEWVAGSSYSGPILIRGRRLDGSGAVGFGEGKVPDDELQLLQSGRQAPKPPGGGRAWLSFTRVRSTGCYAYQVDGTSFSRVIVFRAR
jgi:hypothetical protein